jgi:hypothetical protein
MFERDGAASCTGRSGPESDHDAHALRRKPSRRHHHHRRRSAPAIRSEFGAIGCSAPTAAPITYQGRCGHGPRLPLLVISPYARANFVDHTRTDQTSILRFIEDNWKTGRIGDESLDDRAGPLDALFELHRRHPADADAESAHGQPAVTAGTSCAHSAVRVGE